MIILDFFINLLGIIGLLFIGIAVVLEVKNKLYKDHHIFILLNMIGTLLLSINALYFKVWIFLILNFGLFLINFYYFWRIYFIDGIKNKK